MIDYHIHSNFSVDSQSEIEDIVKVAIEKNLDEIMITDHIEFDSYAKTIEPNTYPLDEYVKKIEYCKDKYKNKISLKLGVEISLEPQLKDIVSEAVGRADYEYIIGSSHKTNKMEIYYDGYFNNLDKHTAYMGYFEEVLENIKTFDNYSVYGHLDYLVRYGRYSDNYVYYSEYKEIIDEILKLSISRGKGFEVNASGIRYGFNTVHPQLEILKRYKELGGEILTIGSDAHKITDIASGFKEALEIIKEAGFEYLAKFENRKPVYFKI